MMTSYPFETATVSQPWNSVGAKIRLTPFASIDDTITYSDMNGYFIVTSPTYEMIKKQRNRAIKELLRRKWEY